MGYLCAPLVAGSLEAPSQYDTPAAHVAHWFAALGYLALGAWLARAMWPAYCARDGVRDTAAIIAAILAAATAAVLVHAVWLAAAP